jgi:polygalacturonase
VSPSRRELLAGGLGWALAAAGCRFQATRPPQLPPLATPPLATGAVTPWPAADAILAATQRPRIRDVEFPLGARGDGRSDDTDAFLAAIAACSRAGGGRVSVPPGEFRTGAIRLLDGVELHLQRGATLRFCDDARRYPKVLTRYEGLECLNRSPMIYAFGARDIALTGEGTLDASGTAAWNRGRERAALEAMVARGLAPEARDVSGILRASFVEPYRSERVLIRGVTLTGSRFWQIHPTLCRHVTVEEVTTVAPPYGTTDGCDPESCDHVVIRGCTLGSGDDNIALKSGRDGDGRRLGVPCSNVVILGCQGEGPNAFIACGSEQSGGISDIYAFDNRAWGHGVGAMLRVKSNSRRGGYTRNVNIDTFVGRGLRDSVLEVEMRYGGQHGGFPPVVDGLHLRRIEVAGAPRVLDLRGLPEDPIGTITVRESRFTDIGFSRNRIEHAPRVEWSGVTIDGRSYG